MIDLYGYIVNYTVIEGSGNSDVYVSLSLTRTQDV